MSGLYWLLRSLPRHIVLRCGRALQVLPIMPRRMGTPEGRMPDLPGSPTRRCPGWVTRPGLRGAGTLWLSCYEGLGASLWSMGVAPANWGISSSTGTRR